MVLSREIDIKLCQIYTKIHIKAILYKSCSIKQIIFNKYTTNSLSRDTDGNHVTSILDCPWREFWSRDMVVNLTFIRFGIILHSFMSISRDKNIRFLRYRSIAEIFRFQPTSPFIFPLQSL